MNVNKIFVVTVTVTKTIISIQLDYIDTTKYIHSVLLARGTRMYLLSVLVDMVQTRYIGTEKSTQLAYTMIFNLLDRIPCINYCLVRNYV